MSIFQIGTIRVLVSRLRKRQNPNLCSSVTCRSVHFPVFINFLDNQRTMTDAFATYNSPKVAKMRLPLSWACFC